MKPRRIDKMENLVAEKGLRLFEREPWVNPRTGRVDSRVLGDRPRFKFLVAHDEWERTFAPLLVSEFHHLEYGGWPVELDNSLSDGSIVFVEDVS